MGKLAVPVYESAFQYMPLYGTAPRMVVTQTDIKLFLKLSTLLSTGGPPWGIERI